MLENVILFSMIVICVIVILVIVSVPPLQQKVEDVGEDEGGGELVIFRANHHRVISLVINNLRLNLRETDRSDRGEICALLCSGNHIIIASSLQLTDDDTLRNTSQSGKANDIVHHLRHRVYLLN